MRSFSTWGLVRLVTSYLDIFQRISGPLFFRGVAIDGVNTSTTFVEIIPWKLGLMIFRNDLFPMIPSSNIHQVHLSHEKAPKKCHRTSPKEMTKSVKRGWFDDICEKYFQVAHSFPLFGIHCGATKIMPKALVLRCPRTKSALPVTGFLMVSSGFVTVEIYSL